MAWDWFPTGKPMVKPHVSIFFLGSLTPPQKHGLIGTNGCGEHLKWNTNAFPSNKVSYPSLRVMSKFRVCFHVTTNTFGLAMANPHNPKYGHMMTYAKNAEYTNDPFLYFLNIVIHIYFFKMQISVRSHWAVKKRDTTRRHDPFFCQPALEEPEKSLPYTLILAKIAKAKSWNQQYACVMRDA